jgi:hypothetical protein
MAIVAATDGGWKRPTIGPGLEDFKAGDARAEGGVVAAGGPVDAAPRTSTGNTARIALEPAPLAPVDPGPAPAGGLKLTQAQLLDLIKSILGVLTAVTGVVAKMVEQRGLTATAKI